MAKTYSITDLAQEFGLTTRSIRFYEDKGLLKPKRSGQRRIYAPRDHVRLKLILRGKRLGLSLEEIKEILDMYSTEAGETRQLQRLLQTIEERRAALRQQQEDINAILQELDSFEAQCRAALAQGGS